MTLHQIKKRYLTELSHLFPDTEIESFFLLTLSFFFNLKRIDLALKPDLIHSDWDAKPFLDTLNRLKKEEPIQYIFGQTEFASLVFEVNKHVLIPRPETEELIHWIAESVLNKNSVKILDIGTGSGCIPIVLATLLQQAEIHALDVSETALKIAGRNAKKNNVSVKFYHCDILKTIDLEEKYDIIVSNPPYVKVSEKNQMRGNVLKYEPDLALYVTDDEPLLFYNKIAELARLELNQGGQLYFEINESLDREMRNLLMQKGFSNIEAKKDIYGKNRMIRAIKN